MEDISQVRVSDVRLRGTISKGDKRVFASRTPLPPPGTVLFDPGTTPALPVSPTRTEEQSSRPPRRTTTEATVSVRDASRVGFSTVGEEPGPLPVSRGQP